jgi:hypothetical protein
VREINVLSLCFSRSCSVLGPVPQPHICSESQLRQYGAASIPLEKRRLESGDPDEQKLIEKDGE